ncbi:hypothetical protein AYL99_05190 [Fonsecaea erecta]|uniref:SAP domain-containing protein n=1 Tax=Fonsecaea erecta TaxID=1367422 RepID=A0A178ZK63_9EURO|nr:hypothetical protein AYL99_05190 [Fonsecaea erecta]OAP60188.1 hypothetical protein AYL99_05190 [Fonsecaea erecta]
MKRLNRHLNPSGRKEGVDGTASRVEPTEEELPVAAAAHGNNTWFRFLSMTEVDLSTAEDFLEYVKEHPSATATDAEVLLSPRVVDNAAASQLLDDLRNEDMVRGFQRRIDYTLQVNEETDVWRLRQRFTWLMWYDIVKAVRPDVSGRRLGRKVKEDVRAFVATVESDEDQVEVIVANISSWCRYGMRLQAMCDIFGEGCILILLPQLTYSFITGKRMHVGGRGFQAAMEHLDSIGLKQVLDDHPHIQELAAAMREVLCSSVARQVPAHLRARGWTSSGGDATDQETLARPVKALLPTVKCGPVPSPGSDIQPAQTRLNVRGATGNTAILTITTIVASTMADVEQKPPTLPLIPQALGDIHALDHESLLRHCALRKLNTSGDKRLLNRRLQAWYLVDDEADLALRGGRERRRHRRSGGRPSVLSSPAPSTGGAHGHDTNLRRCLLDVLVRGLTVYVFVGVAKQALAGYGDEKLRALEPEEYREWRHKTQSRIMWAQGVFIFAPLLHRLCTLLETGFAREGTAATCASLHTDGYRVHGGKDMGMTEVVEFHDPLAFSHGSNRCIDNTARTSNQLRFPETWGVDGCQHVPRREVINIVHEVPGQAEKEPGWWRETTFSTLRIP